MRRRRFRQLAAGALALPAYARARARASLSGAAGAHHRGLHCRRRRRHHRAPHWPGAGGAAGKAFIIENRPGAATNLATEAVVRAPADGYTLLMANTAAAINATLYDKLNFDFIRDMAPVAAVMHGGWMHPSFPARTLPEFIAYTKANPGKTNMGTSGSGASDHMAGELFKMMTGVSLVHVAYRGAAPALTDLLGGQVQVMFGRLPTSIEHIRAGRLRGLAVTTATRSDTLPDLPIVGDFVPGYEASGWYGVCAPKGTPAEVNGALADDKLKARLAELGGAALPGSPASFGKLIAEETEKWGR